MMQEIQALHSTGSLGRERDKRHSFEGHQQHSGGIGGTSSHRTHLTDLCPPWLLVLQAVIRAAWVT
jgi:hypothetical protein